MVIIDTISNKYFSLNSIMYARIYQPLKKGTTDIGIVSIYDTRLQLLASTHYSQLQINDVVYTNQADAIAQLLGVIWADPATLVIDDDILQKTPADYALIKTEIEALGVDASTVDGASVSASALGATILKRDAYGDIVTAAKVIFHNGDSVAVDDALNRLLFHIDGNTYVVWHNGNDGKTSGLVAQDSATADSATFASAAGNSNTVGNKGISRIAKAQPFQANEGQLDLLTGVEQEFGFVDLGIGGDVVTKVWNPTTNEWNLVGGGGSGLEVDDGILTQLDDSVLLKAYDSVNGTRTVPTDGITVDYNVIGDTVFGTCVILMPEYTNPAWTTIIADGEDNYSESTNHLYIENMLPITPVEGTFSANIIQQLGFNFENILPKHFDLNVIDLTVQYAGQGGVYGTKNTEGGVIVQDPRSDSYESISSSTLSFSFTYKRTY